MSYGGHVQDMITRYKENRKLLNNRREQARKNRRKYAGKVVMPENTTAEELGRIARELRNRETEQDIYFIRMQLYILAAALALGLAAWFIFW